MRQCQPTGHLRPPSRFPMRASRSGTGQWAAAALFSLALAGPPAPAQEMLRYLDLKSEEFTKADVSRAEIEAALAAAGPTGLVDLTGRRRNGPDPAALALRRTELHDPRV